LQIGGAFVSLGSVESGTAYWAHVGGFAMGLVLSIIFGAPQHAHRERAHEAIDQMDSRSPAAKLAAAELVLKTHPHDVKALRDKADALSLQNDSDEEATSGGRAKGHPDKVEQNQPFGGSAVAAAHVPRRQV
jgi:hypothetical protein